MAIEKSQLESWLKTLEEAAEVAIDEGGLALTEVGGSAYLEIGGDPEGVKLSREFKTGIYFFHDNTLCLTKEMCVVSQGEISGDFAVLLDLDEDATPKDALRIAVLFDANTDFLGYKYRED